MVSLDEKVDYLRRPETHMDKPRQVEVIETHYACVFLTEHFVYKLKKPNRFRESDYTALEKRQRFCQRELKLNRRLAEDVYIDVVPLTLTPKGLVLEGNGEPIEWLVKMHRLPRAQMLDRAAAARTVTPESLDALIEKLAAFYAQTMRAPWSASEYRARLSTQLADWVQDLAAVGDQPVPPGLETLCQAQRECIHEKSSLFDQRIATGRVREVHGDLRPEHICLGANPQIIDCPEFSDELRLLDTAEELAFLDLECERLGRRDLGPQLRRRYQRRCDDPLEPALYGFFRSRRALARARVSAWHVQNGLSDKAVQRWTRRRDWYLQAAFRSLGT
jgi:aminoglycoside phosphotransferase family enzyme